MTSRTREQAIGEFLFNLNAFVNYRVTEALCSHYENEGKANNTYNHARAEKVRERAMDKLARMRTELDKVIENE